jgi:hypothetical protein
MQDRRQLAHQSDLGTLQGRAASPHRSPQPDLDAPRRLWTALRT